ncbi:translation initiation factor eIF3e [Schizosaccharomyces osmophilus]|uniref:Eukaryotic translation initiation factor 3 subunit E n=1 Tax=Schizosaccharomyces osmophilus TaxID=2545709 RepID=A0AAE9WCP0_9SCHI|nr:translation initiation factor eIF3e [Schizosaccharomyces osmophilus]WBW72293.1 translation initiation factor eIF3e [Schizosaccharomyces osmophilus]
MSSEVKSASSLAAKYDLSQKIMQHLDRHLIFPLLEFLSLRNTHNPKELLQAKYDLLKDTNMTDYVANLWTELHGGQTDEALANQFAEKRKSVLDELSELEEEVQGILGVLENPDLIAALRQDKGQNLQHLQEHYSITPERIAVLYKFAQFQYNCGNYGGASDLLYHFRAFSKDADLNASATWGKFASEILTVDWDGAMEELGKLREMVDSRSFKDAAVQLKDRTWLLHWSLFPLFNHANGCDTLCDLFFYTPYLNTIQTSCPWLLRYLAVAVVTNQNNANQKPRNPRQSYQRRMRDLIRIINQESYEYSDPITSFVSALYSEVDFEKAQRCLRECEEVLKTDFFLVSLCDHFMEAARKLLAEAYCRIHSVISVDELANKLEMDSAQLIQLVENQNNASSSTAAAASSQANLDESDTASSTAGAGDIIPETETTTEAEEPEPEPQFGFKAKMDGESIIIEHPKYSAFQQIIDRTKSLGYESQNLEQTLSRSIADLKLPSA